MRRIRLLSIRLPRARRVLIIPVLALIPFPAVAGHLVTLVNGSSLDVESYRLEGPRIVFTLEGGGEIGIPPVQVSSVSEKPATPAAPTPTGPSLPLEDTGRPLVTPPAPAGLAPPGVSPFDPEPGVRALIGEMAAGMGVEARLVEALVEAESNFDPYAVSRRGAMGLMQLMPLTARRFKVENVFDPRQNLEGGMRYLKELLARYSDTALALAAYNAGEEAVDRYGGIPPFKETRGYVKRILLRLKS